MNDSPSQTWESLRAKLQEARRKLDAAEKTMAEAERVLKAIAKEGHAPACRYFNGMDMACTCGFDP